MIIYKTSKEIEIMRKGGRIAALVMKKISGSLKEGVSALEIDRIAENEIVKYGALPSFRGFEDYQYSTCININEGVVHGIPKDSLILRNGDVVKVDLGVLYRGWHSDTAMSYIIGGEKNFPEKSHFLQVGKDALSAAINECRLGARIGDISEMIQVVIEGAGYQVVEELVGHGVGKNLHEDPLIPGKGRSDTGPVIKSGMTLALEVIYTLGKTRLVTDEDGWTLSTADGKIAGLFEHTVAISSKGVEVLTLGDYLC